LNSGAEVREASEVADYGDDLSNLLGKVVSISRTKQADVSLGMGEGNDVGVQKVFHNGDVGVEGEDVTGGVERQLSSLIDSLGDKPVADKLDGVIRGTN
jgi:hypothetical protein